MGQKSKTGISSLQFCGCFRNPIVNRGLKIETDNSWWSITHQKSIITMQLYANYETII